MAYGTAGPTVVAGGGGVGFIATVSGQGIGIEDPTFTSPANGVLGINADGDVYGVQLDLISDQRLPVSFAPGLRLATDFSEYWLAYFDGSVKAKGDYSFQSNAVGPVLLDQSDGHAYRIISTDGVLSVTEIS